MKQNLFRRAGLALALLLALCAPHPAALAEADDSYFEAVPGVVLPLEEEIDSSFEPAPENWPEDDYDTQGAGALSDVPDSDEAFELLDDAYAPVAGSEYTLDDALADAVPTFPRTFTITVGGDTTLGSTDALRKRDDCFENVAAEKGYAWFLSGLTELFGADDLTLVNF